MASAQAEEREEEGAESQGRETDVAGKGRLGAAVGGRSHRGGV